MVLRFRPESSKKVVFGEVAEWLKAAVLKTVERLRVPGVRIPPSPPLVSVAILSNKNSVFGNQPMRFYP
jgi:hypothetical protein